MNFVRLGQLISHECEWQLRDLAAYTGALLGLGRADDERNPIRAEIIGASLHRGIEAISGERESRRLLTRELGQAMAQAMPKCYEDILKMFQERGVRPVNLTVRTVEGPGQPGGRRQLRLPEPARRPRLVARRRLRRDRFGPGVRQRDGPARRPSTCPGDGVPARSRARRRQHPRQRAGAARQRRVPSARERRRPTSSS